MGDLICKKNLQINNTKLETLTRSTPESIVAVFRPGENNVKRTIPTCVV